MDEYNKKINLINSKNELIGYTTTEIMNGLGTTKQDIREMIEDIIADFVLDLLWENEENRKDS